MPLTLVQVQLAQGRLAPYVENTPLLRLKALDGVLGCEVYAKAECLQVTGAFKLRGALNKVLLLTATERRQGLVAASSGNHGKALAYVAKLLGIKATIIMPYAAPKIKIAAVRALGAEVILCETAERFSVAEQVCKKSGATMVPPFNDEEVMAGQGTVGLEIIEQCPELDSVIVPVSGGGLLGGVSLAIKTLAPKVLVYGAEPAALPRYTNSLAAGKPVTVPQKSSIADALVSQAPGEKCFPYVKAHVDAFAAVEEIYILKAMKLLLMEGKILAEPSSCIGLGAVLQGLLPIEAGAKVCFVISGGSVSFEQLKILDDVTL